MSLSGELVTLRLGTHLYNVIKEDISLPETFPLSRKYVRLAIVHPGKWPLSWWLWRERKLLTLFYFCPIEKNLVHLPMFSTKRSRVQEGRQSKSSPNSNSPWSGLDAVWIRFGSGLDQDWMRFGCGLDRVWIRFGSNSPWSGLDGREQLKAHRLWRPSCRRRWGRWHWGWGGSPMILFASLASP